MGEGGTGEGRGSTALFLKHPLGSLFSFLLSLSHYDDDNSTNNNHNNNNNNNNNFNNTSITCTHFSVLN